MLINAIVERLLGKIAAFVESEQRKFNHLEFPGRPDDQHAPAWIDRLASRRVQAICRVGVPTVVLAGAGYAAWRLTH
jgi:hypothetical protein